MASGTIKKITTIGYADVVQSGLNVKPNGTTAIQLGRTFDSTVIGIEITRAWPSTTWDNGALVGIVQWNYEPSTGVVSLTLSTTVEQAYDVTFRGYYMS